MSDRLRELALGCAAAGLLVGLAGCGSNPAGPEELLQRQLDQVRSATAAYQDFQAAQAAGYSAALTGCMSDPQGGMGFHYGKPPLIDGAVNLMQPEVLLYEPQPDGSLRLVGIEYIVPLGAWTSPQPPTLLGQTFHRNDAFGLWALHAWIWRDNPSGVFEDWNPRVSCAAAQ